MNYVRICKSCTTTTVHALKLIISDNYWLISDLSEVDAHSRYDMVADR